MYLGGVKEGSALSVVVDPSARETFTPRELTDAFEDFIERGPQYLDAETRIRASAYRYGERVLCVYEEARRAWSSLVTRRCGREGLSDVCLPASQITLRI
jgi:ribosomal protein S18 acetylase RimI-like enzyme